MKAKKGWTWVDIPDQRGKIAVITGANNGQGYETSLALARKHTHVIMACRNLDKAQAARESMINQVPTAKIDLMHLDLACLASIRTFATAYREQYDQLHILINNAGVSAIPCAKTDDGFEMQFGINHLGHFALSGLLLDRILKTPASRVITVSSHVQYTLLALQALLIEVKTKPTPHNLITAFKQAQYAGKINFNDLHGERSYSRYVKYAQSKLANVMFAVELQQRFEAAGNSAISVSTHPGIAVTNLFGHTVFLEKLLYAIINKTVAQNAALGARYQLYAATMPDVQPGKQYGPAFLTVRGRAKQVHTTRKAYNEQNRKRLWQISEQLTGVTYKWAA